MNKANKRRRMARAAACLLAGAILMQLGPCSIMALSTGTAGFNFGSLLDKNGNFLGIFNMCGVPDVQQVDANGVPVGGILNAADDLIIGCPYTIQTIP